MALLRVFKHQELAQEINLQQGQTYLAGRAENCQIRLDPEPGISRNHFQLSFENQIWQLKVLSRYGELYFDDQKASEMNLNDGMSFTVPPYQFEFSQDSIQVASQVSSGEATVVSVLPSSAYLRVIDERGVDRQVFRLEGDAWSIGRDITCAIQLDYPKASRKQCEIYREAENYFIRDLGSSNGTSVNGHFLSREEWTRLQSGDTIAIIDWILKFEVRDNSFKDRIESVPQDLRGPMLYEDVTSHSGISVVNNNSGVFQPESTRIENVPLPPSPGTWQDVISHPNPAPFENAQAGASSPVYNSNEIPVQDIFDGPWTDKKKIMNPVRWIIVLLIVGAGGFYFWGGSEESAPSEVAKTNRPKSPFDALSPEDQQFVRRAYENAKANLINRKYTEALQEITRMKEKVAQFEDSAEIEKYANQGILSLEQIKNEEAKVQKDLEIEQKIQSQVKICKAKINPKTWDMAQLDDCLSSVLALNPEHPAFQALRAQISGYEQARNTQKVMRQKSASESSQLHALYNKAKNLVERHKIADALPALQKVVDSHFYDYDGLKTKARQEKSALVATMDEQQRELETSAESLMKEGRYREAVLALRQALEINPDNEICKGRLRAAMLELRKLMQPIYQESIVEESVGDAEKAKERWKKILDSSVIGEEYYEKSRLKLKKYGVL